MPPTNTTIDQATGEETHSIANTCGGDGSFRVTANATQALNGCFLDTGVLLADGKIFYTVSGTMNTTEIVVTSVENVLGNDVRHICRPRIATTTLCLVRKK